MKPCLRRLAWVGVALCVVALAFGVTARLLGPEPPGITAANCGRIRKGMTMPEVQAILGKDAFFVRWRQAPKLQPGINPYVINELPEAQQKTKWSAAVYVTWFGGLGNATVRIDPNDQVISASFLPHSGAGPLDRLRAWLGW